MNEVLVLDLVFAHGPRLLGIVVSLLFLVLFWRYRIRVSAGEALLASVVSFLLAFGVEYMTLPLTVLYMRPDSPLDLLTFKVIVASSPFLSIGYALMVFAGFRLMQDAFFRAERSDPDSREDVGEP